MAALMSSGGFVTVPPATIAVRTAPTPRAAGARCPEMIVPESMP